tara:strand:+ start:41862 stop:42296 length:435 start_codon:yes stop_codon:yes gene_type:complete
MRVAEILLVEDNPADIELTKEALFAERFQVNLHVVTDGVEAIRFLNREGEYAHAIRPDIIFLDLNLPKKDGREVLSDIKSNDKFKSIPIVVLTTSDNASDVNDSYQKYANCYIQKPMDFVAFRRAIQSTKSFWFTVVKLPEGGG